MTASTIPPTSELYSLRDLAARHPNLLSESRLRWALRNRTENGLEAARIVFATRGGEVVIHEPAFLQWWLNLSGRHTPRAPRRKRPRAAA